MKVIGISESGSRKLMYCSFCNRSQHEARKLIVGRQDLSICDSCVLKIGSVYENEDLSVKISKTDIVSSYLCPFCEKPQDEIFSLLPDQVGKICKECILLCTELINE